MNGVGGIRSLSLNLGSKRDSGVMSAVFLRLVLDNEGQWPSGQGRETKQGKRVAMATDRQTDGSRCQWLGFDWLREACAFLRS